MKYTTKLKNTLSDPELVQDWSETIKNTLDDNNKERELLNWIKDLRDEFIDLSEEVNDREDLKRSNLIRYIEIKAKWMILNTHMQYQAVNSGGPDPEIMVKGSIISRLLEKHEECLSDKQVNKIAEYLSEPLKSFRKN